MYCFYNNVCEFFIFLPLSPSSKIILFSNSMVLTGRKLDLVGYWCDWCEEVRLS